MRSLKNFFRLASILAFAAIALTAAVPAEIVAVDVAPTISSGSTTGTAADIGAHAGRLVMVRVIAPDITSATVTIKIRDENNAAMWSVASIAENATTFLMPENGASSAPAPDWAAGVPVPIASGTRSGTGLGSSASTTWDVTATGATTEAALRTIAVRLYIDQE